jgi:hypothetical protein
MLSFSSPSFDPTELGSSNAIEPFLKNLENHTINLRFPRHMGCMISLGSISFGTRWFGVLGEMCCLFYD